MTTDAFETIAKGFDPPLVIVTTAAGDQRAGCVVGFHSQCSIDPLRYAVWLSKANLTYRVALLATHVAVHVPVAGDKELIELFGGTTGDEVDKFARCEWTAGPGRRPAAGACPNRIVLERTSLHDDGGDHVCCVGEPVHAETTGELTRCACPWPATSSRATTPTTTSTAWKTSPPAPATPSTSPPDATRS